MTIPVTNNQFSNWLLSCHDGLSDGVCNGYGQGPGHRSENMIITMMMLPPMPQWGKDEYKDNKNYKDKNDKIMSPQCHSGTRQR